MAENGGGLSSAQRFDRLEAQIERALKEVSIERHRVTNILQIEKLHTEILTTLKDHETRLTEIERREVAEEAVTTALSAARKEAQSNKRWVIGVCIIGGGGLFINAVMLMQVLGKVN